MTGGPKIFALLAASLLAIALSLSACGGGSSDSSSSSSTEAGRAQAEGGSGGSGSRSGEAKDDEADEGGSESSSHVGEATNFTPTQHSDSGGGSQQYVQKGGDNSVQEFGQEADREEFDAAAAALHDFLDARAEGNWAAACGYMSKTVVESLEKLAAQAKKLKDEGCAGILEKLTNPAAKSVMKQEAEQADVGSLRVEGDRSFVIFKGPKGAVLAMPMANEDGDWKVASLAGTPLN